MKNKRVVHRFTNKWWVGTWTVRRIGSGECKGMWNVLFPTEEDFRITVLWACKLTLDGYGPSKTWVNVARESAAQKRARLAASC